MIKGEPSKEKEKKHPNCYECKKPRHFRADCPLLKKAPRRMKKKAMLATWSNNDHTSSEKEERHQEIANMYLMAHENEVCSGTQIDFSFKELQDAFFELMLEYKKLSLKNKELK